MEIVEKLEELSAYKNVCTFATLLRLLIINEMNI